MELNNLKMGYILNFLFYLVYVICIFKYYSEHFSKVQNLIASFLFLLPHLLTKNFQDLSNSWTYVIHQSDASMGHYSLTVTTIIVSVITLILMAREFYQLAKQGRRYFSYFENVIEWSILLLVVFSLIPISLLKLSTGPSVQRHLAAFTFLLALIQLYLLLVRIVPNTPIPLYINMFTTVLKTYTFILLSYAAFLLSFAFSFSLVYSNWGRYSYYIYRST